MTAPSLKERMLGILLGIFAVVWMSVGAITFMSVKHEVRDVFDAQLAQAARVLATLVRKEVSGLGDVPTVSDNASAMQIHDLEPDFLFQVLVNNIVVMRSQSAPQTPIWDHVGYQSLEVGTNPWRILRYEPADSPAVIIVGGRRAERARLVQSVAVETMWPLLVALPILALAALIGVRQALLPLNRVKNEIRERTLDELGPMDRQIVPKEIAPLIDALNTLFARLAEALDRERRFTSYAAHELRTPLAALKAQAHVAIAARDESSRNKAVENIATGVEQAAKLVDQLLTLARLDPPHTKMRRDSVDLNAVAQDTADGLRPNAEARNLTLTVETTNNANIAGDYAALSILARNLIDNAIRYSPEGGHITVTVGGDRKQVTLAISDTGSGIAEDEREAVFERFYRIVGNKSEGSGLGLSIARRVAELHNGSIALSNRPQGGLMVSVRFPRLG